MKRVLVIVATILCASAYNVVICQNRISLQVELSSRYGAYGESDGYDTCSHLSTLTLAPKVLIFGESITEGTYDDFLVAIQGHVPYHAISKRATIDGQIKYIKLYDFDYGGVKWSFVELTFCRHLLSSYKLYSIKFEMGDENTLTNQAKQNQIFEDLKSRILKKYTRGIFSWIINRFSPSEYCINLMQLNSRKTYDSAISISISQGESISKGGEYRQYLTLYYQNDLMADWYNSYTDDDF